MKKLSILFFALVALLQFAVAQVPQGINYQTVVRNTNGNPVTNQAVAFRISVLEDSPIGNAVYTEEHRFTTNAFGLVNFVIGSGNTTLGNFEAINWGSTTFFIKVETDITGGSNYVETGTQQLMSVPYALYTKAASYADSVDIDAQLQNSTTLNTTILSVVASNPSITDNQTLTLSNDTLYIERGNFVVLPDIVATVIQNIDSILLQSNNLDSIIIAQTIQNIDSILSQSSSLDSIIVSNTIQNIDSILTYSNTLDSIIINTVATSTYSIDTAYVQNDSLFIVNGNGNLINVGNVRGPQGPQGVQGPTGATGAQGPAGPQGATGATGAQGIQGPQGVAGTNGTNGVDGKTILNGTSNPSTALGTTGDFYINTTNNTLFGPKTVSGWGSGTSLVGPQGTAGATGPQGATGATGATGAQGPQGATGFLQNGTSTGNTPYWNGTQWVVNSSNIYNDGGGVGIGTTPDASAKLDVSSSTQGFLPPRLTTAERDAIATPAVGLVIYNTTTNCLNFYVGAGWNETCGIPSLPLGLISSLNCVSATVNGTLTEGSPASGVSSEIPYTGGNGGLHNGQSVTSTGITGLTATLSAGSFASGAGNLTYTITGTPSASGTANFALNIGGQSCSLNLTVSNSGGSGSYPPGTVHCSGTPTAVVDVTNPATGRIWMDRNLGASQVATSYFAPDEAAYGDLYQWGRRSDGHQCRNSATTTNLSSTDTPAHGSFITTSSFPSDWRSPQNTNLWQGVNGVNNPCPIGYRLPTETELNAELTSWSSNDAAGALASPLKLPRAGSRSSTGSFSGIGGSARYWSSTVSSTDSRTLSFSSTVAFMSNGSRSNGFSVRCIKN